MFFQPLKAFHDLMIFHKFCIYLLRIDIESSKTPRCFSYFRTEIYLICVCWLGKNLIYACSLVSVLTTKLSWVQRVRQAFSFQVFQHDQLHVCCCWLQIKLKSERRTTSEHEGSCIVGQVSSSQMGTNEKEVVEEVQGAKGMKYNCKSWHLLLALHWLGKTDEHQQIQTQFCLHTLGRLPDISQERKIVFRF